jgi:hypothetical protein
LAPENISTVVIKMLDISQGLFYTEYKPSVFGKNAVRRDYRGIT